jgi:hypothetical protein
MDDLVSRARRAEGRTDGAFGVNMSFSRVRDATSTKVIGAEYPAPTTPAGSGLIRPPFPAARFQRPR